MVLAELVEGAASVIWRDHVWGDNKGERALVI